MVNRFYPIGSVIKLEPDSDRMVMIVGFYPINNEINQLYQYLAVPYPGGINNDYSFQVFNHEDIREDLFMGYLDEKGDALMDALPALEEKIIKVMQGED